MPGNEADDLRLIMAAAREAGALASDFFASGARRWTKAGDSPVTEADMAVDSLLHERLTAARPDYGWLSEESVDDPARLSRRRVFIVDPIDGTRAFIDGEDGWVIAIAVVEDGQPVAGVVFQPLPGRMWSASAGGGAHLDDSPIKPAGRDDIAGARIAASKGAARSAGLGAYESTITRRYTKSLAYRLARVADGGFDAAIASSRAHDWDLAAAALLVQEAGGRISDLDGAPLRFNRPDTRHPPLIAAGAPLHARLVAAARDRRETAQ